MSLHGEGYGQKDRPGVTDLLHVDEQRLLVVLPLDGKLADVRELVAGQLHRHLEAVVVQVAEVVHTCREDVRAHDPRGAEGHILVY